MQRRGGRARAAVQAAAGRPPGLRVRPLALERVTKLLQDTAVDPNPATGCSVRSDGRDPYLDGGGIGRRGRGQASRRLLPTRDPQRKDNDTSGRRHPVSPAQSPGVRRRWTSGTTRTTCTAISASFGTNLCISASLVRTGRSPEPCALADPDPSIERVADFKYSSPHVRATRFPGSTSFRTESLDALRPGADVEPGRHP